MPERIEGNSYLPFSMENGGEGGGLSFQDDISKIDWPASSIAANVRVVCRLFEWKDKHACWGLNRLDDDEEEAIENANFKSDWNAVSLSVCLSVCLSVSWGPPSQSGEEQSTFPPLSLAIYKRGNCQFMKYEHTVIWYLAEARLLYYYVIKGLLSRM